MEEESDLDKQSYYHQIKHSDAQSNDDLYLIKRAFMMQKASIDQNN